MNKFFASTLLFFGLGTAGGCSTPTLEQELKTLSAPERQALTDLLKGTGVATEGLRSIGILGIPRNPRGLAIDAGHVVALRLSDVTVPDLEPTRRLPALQTLWLTGCTVPSIAGLAGQSSLTELSLAGSGLTSLAGLSNLPQLKELNLDDNKLRSLAELKGLPALKKVSARNNQLTENPALGDKMAIALDGNPLNKAAEPTAATTPAAATAPAGLVTELPKSDGKTTGKGPHQTKGVLLGNPPLEASGVYDSLVGVSTMGITPIKTADSTVDFELTVDTGRVRVYLEDQSRKGYLYAEATPGHPAHLNGRMIYGVTAFQVVIESMEGTATGLHYHLVRASR